MPDVVVKFHECVIKVVKMFSSFPQLAVHSLGHKSVEVVTDRCRKSILVLIKFLGLHI